MCEPISNGSIQQGENPRITNYSRRAATTHVFCTKKSCILCLPHFEFTSVWEGTTKRTKTQRSRILSPVTDKSLGESLAIKVPSDVLPETDPAKEPASSSPEGKKELQTDLQGRALQSFGISRPDSSEIKGLGNVALIPYGLKLGKPRWHQLWRQLIPLVLWCPQPWKGTGLWPLITYKELSQSMSNIFMNTFSPTPASPATKTHKKRKAKKDPVEVSIIQLKPEDRKRV